MANYGTHEPAIKSEYQVCCITMNLRDRLRLLACPPDLTPLIRTCILETWGPVQSEREYHGSHEFKLKGYPWLGRGEDAVSSRRLLAGILAVMAKQGWNLLQSTDISRKTTTGDKDALFFELGDPDPEPSLFAMSFNMRDRIRIIDFPHFMPNLKEAVYKCWPQGIQSEKEYHGSLELKLGGNPWHPMGEETVFSKLLLSQIIANFRAAEYKLYASVDISYGHEGDLESWVFRKVGQKWQ